MTKILIINTDHNSTQTLLQILESNGFQVEIQASVSQKNRQTVQQPNPDIILLDLSKSNGKALEMCQAVRKANAAPLVVLSCGSCPDTVAKVLDAGADDYLVKPVSNQVLFASIRKLTRRKLPDRNVLPMVNSIS